MMEIKNVTKLSISYFLSVRTIYKFNKYSMSKKEGKNTFFNARSNDQYFFCIPMTSWRHETQDNVWKGRKGKIGNYRKLYRRH